MSRIIASGKGIFARGIRNPGARSIQQNFRAKVRKLRGDEWIATTTGLVPFLSQTEKMSGVLLLVSEFIEDDFDVLNDIVKDDDDIVIENELFED